MERLTRHSRQLGFAALISAAFFVRVYGLDFPQYHWDELLDLNNVFSASYNRLALLNYGHGSLHPYLILLVWKIYLLFTGSELTTSALLHLFFEDPGPFFLLARGLMAVISTISVALVYFLAEKLYNKRVGWLSAILLAGTFLHASESHYASSIHVLSTLFIVLTLFFCHRIMENGHKRDYILGGVSFGLAVAAQYSVAIAFVPILYAHIKYTYNSGKNRKPLVILLNRSLLLSGVVAVVTFFCVTPYAALDAQRFVVEMQQILDNVTRVWISSDGQPIWLFYLTEHLRNGMGTFLALTSIAGFIYALIRRTQSDLLLSIFLVISFISLAKGANFARYLVPSLPALAILSGALLDGALRSLDSKLSKPQIQLLGAMVVAGLLAQPVMNIIRFDFWLTQPDTREIASQWILSNVPPGSSIAIEGANVLGPNVPMGQRQLEKLLDVQSKGSLGEVYTKALFTSQPLDTDYTILSVFRLDERHKSGQFVGEITSVLYYRELGYDYLITSSWIQRDVSALYPTTFQDSLDKYYQSIKTFEPTIRFLFDLYAWRMDYDALDKVIIGQQGIGGPKLTIYKLRDTEQKTWRTDKQTVYQELSRPEYDAGLAWME